MDLLSDAVSVYFCLPSKIDGDYSGPFRNADNKPLSNGVVLRGLKAFFHLSV
ncbi:hypothetical protein VCHA37P193_390035 [Vibrio chagasii]|nr:hypothetical protein VCHA37P193_390035 [Vibrio chagasii]